MLSKAGEVDEAAGHLEQATRTAVDPADAYGELAKVQRARGKVEEAVLAFKQRLRAKPNDADAHLGLAETLAFGKRDAEAVPSQHAGMALDRKRKGASRRLGQMLVRLMRHDEAVEHLENATKEEPEDPALWSLIASCHERAEEPKNAADALLEAVKHSPDDAAPWKRLGLALRKIPGRSRSRSRGSRGRSRSIRA